MLTGRLGSGIGSLDMGATMVGETPDGVTTTDHAIPNMSNGSLRKSLLLFSCQFEYVLHHPKRM